MTRRTFSRAVTSLLPALFFATTLFAQSQPQPEAKNSQCRPHRRRRPSLAGSFYRSGSLAPRFRTWRHLGQSRQLKARILARRRQRTPQSPLPFSLERRCIAGPALRQSAQRQRRSRHQRQGLFLSRLQRNAHRFPRSEDRLQRIRSQPQRHGVRMARQTARTSTATSPSLAPGTSTKISST